MLLVGGGIYALVSYLTVVLTTIRMQKWLAIAFVVAAMLYSVFGCVFGKELSIWGVALLYLIINIVLVIWFIFCLLFKVNQKLDK